MPFECRGRRLRTIITRYRVAVANEAQDAEGDGDESVIIECAGQRKRIAQGQTAEFVLD
jgi:hypothetical protein